MTKAVIETPRLQLREMVWEDRESIAAILQDERVMYAYNGAFSEEETEAWIERQRQRHKEYGFGLWVVLQKESGQVIGQCGITMQGYKDRLVPEIGYLFACKHWHKGYATEAAVACPGIRFQDFAFRGLVFHYPGYESGFDAGGHSQWHEASRYPCKALPWRGNAAYRVPGRSFCYGKALAGSHRAFLIFD